MARSLLALLMFVACSSAQGSSPLVPGTGSFLVDCSDDFEDPGWSFKLNLPKSSHEQDERQRSPGGFSKNKLWHEGAKRGTPDIVRRVATPPGGLPGSTGALLMQTRLSGIPGRLTGEQQQDDLLLKFDRQINRSIPVSWRPSCTVRVYIPPFVEWEQRTGASFGVRADCRGDTPDGYVDAYWPGMFILFRDGDDKRYKQDHAQLSIRANSRGQDMASIKIMEPGWWTLGMSFTPDGEIHYYASEGIDDLTSDDYLTSNYAYSYKCLSFRNFFFNVANMDNGRSWSTAWVIDDPKIYVLAPGGLSATHLPKKKGQRVPSYPVTKVHASDKQKQSGGLFGGLIGNKKRKSSYSSRRNRSAQNSSDKRRR